MNSLADPAETNPILPRLSQRRLGSSRHSTKACVRARPHAILSLVSGVLSLTNPRPLTSDLIMSNEPNFVDTKMNVT